MREWFYELKFDGYRIVAGVDTGQVRLVTRNGADATKWFPEIVAGLATLTGGPHIGLLPVIPCSLASASACWVSASSAALQVFGESPQPYFSRS